MRVKGEDILTDLLTILTILTILTNKKYSISYFSHSVNRIVYFTLVTQVKALSRLFYVLSN